MATPLRIGVAGLGTVGAALVRLIAENGATLARRFGRPVKVVAVSARDMKIILERIGRRARLVI